MMSSLHINSSTVDVPGYLRLSSNTNYRNRRADTRASPHRLLTHTFLALPTILVEIPCTLSISSNTMAYDNFKAISNS